MSALQAGNNEATCICRGDCGERCRALAEVQMRAIEDERTRIAQDMHDAIGADLTLIKLLGELIENDSKDAEKAVSRARLISQTARHLTEHMDEIVWATNPRHDDTESFASYVGDFAVKFLDATPLRFRLAIQPTLPDVPMAPHVRYRLFLAVKEALHNVVKHARANEITLGIAVEEGTLVIRVRDDGCGFARDGIPSGRHGLGGMKSRMAGIGGRCVVRSQKGRGTSLRFSVRLQGA